MPQVPLESGLGVDYAPLRDLLKEGKWREAEDETRAKLIEAAGPEAQKRGWVYFSEASGPAGRAWLDGMVCARLPAGRGRAESQACGASGCQRLPIKRLQRAVSASPNTCAAHALARRR